MPARPTVRRQHIGPRAALTCTALLAIASCASRTKVPVPGPNQATPSAVIASMLADDHHLSWKRDLLNTLDPSSNNWKRSRGQIDAEYRRRSHLALAHRKFDRAYEYLTKSLRLLHQQELRAHTHIQKFLETRKDLLVTLQSIYQKRGDLNKSVLLLGALSFVDANTKSTLQKQLDEIFQFADEQDASEFGEGAQGARVISALEHLVDYLPTRSFLAELQSRIMERHGNLDKIIHTKKTGDDTFRMRVYRAHGQALLRTSYTLARAFAKAGRLKQAYLAVSKLRGLGDAVDLRNALAAAFESSASPQSYVQLAGHFQKDDDPLKDPRATLAVLLQGLARFPSSPELHDQIAALLGELEYPLSSLHHLKVAWGTAPKSKQRAERIARLSSYKISGLLEREQVKEATETLAELEAFYAESKAALKVSIQPDLAKVLASVGRGLIGIGLYKRGVRSLDRSLKLRPNRLVLESLADLAQKQQEPEIAISYINRALELAPTGSSHEFEQAKLLRRRAQIENAIGRASNSKRTVEEAKRTWQSLVNRYQLPPSYLAEAYLELGFLAWEVGAHEQALSSFQRAISAAPDSESIYPTLMSFLLLRDRYLDAREIFHSAVHNDELGDYFKIYMALWLQAEAKTRNVPVDPWARRYLHEVEGELWHEDLARYATGRLAAKDLAQRATTAARKAEYYYYLAVLGTDAKTDEEQRALLEKVIESNLLFFFEYEMASARLR